MLSMIIYHTLVWNSNKQMALISSRLTMVQDSDSSF